MNFFFVILACYFLVDNEVSAAFRIMQPVKTAFRMELIEPLYQECEPRRFQCGEMVSARCRNMGESCAQNDPINS